MAGVLETAQAAIERRGIYIQGVAPRLPVDPAYCYSVGFQVLGPRLPEVIVLGAPVCFSGQLIKGVFQDVCNGWLELRPGTVVELRDPGGPSAVRVGPVLPRWAGAYALLAGDVLGSAPESVPYVQLVLSDAEGRWPDDPAVDRSLLGPQPLLSEELPWMSPIVHTAQEDMYLHHAAGDAVVAMPTYADGRPEGRYELLRAIKVDGGRAVVCQVPWAADYVTVGDVVEARAGDGRAGLPPEALIGGAVLQQGQFEGLAFLLRPVADDDDEAGRLLKRLFGALDDLSADGWRARVSTTVGSVHVNSCEPEVVRAALRPFVRDGLLEEVEPRSGPRSEWSDAAGA